jgi:hypothetical protein
MKHCYGFSGRKKKQLTKKRSIKLLKIKKEEEEKGNIVIL